MTDQEQRERHALVRRRRDRMREESTGACARERLEAALTPEAALGEVEGITVVLKRVELWSARISLTLEALQNGLTVALDEAFEKKWRAYERRWIEHRAQAEAEELTMPEQPSTPRLARLSLSVADDVGTRYHVLGTATGGSKHRWRSEWKIEPEVPASASLLKIVLEGREPVELILPPRG